MLIASSSSLSLRVAPVRERGLKLMCSIFTGRPSRRSREGAWIEMFVAKLNRHQSTVAPVRERGLKFKTRMVEAEIAQVAPVRERGLKC